MNRRKIDNRIISHHLQANNTIVHFISRHRFFPRQLKAVRALHGSCQIVYHDIRFDRKEDFFRLILSLAQNQNTAAIYFVMPNEWRAVFVEKYLDKINGTVVGWFVGFGNSDTKKEEQILVYRHKKFWLKFLIEQNFGRTKIVKRPLQKTNGKERPVKNLHKKTF